MTSIPLLVKDDFKHPKFPTQIDFLGDSPLNHALIAVGQEGYKKPRQNGQAVFRGYWLASWGVDMTACPFCPGSPSG